jgi:hypothetical protein
VIQLTEKEQTLRNHMDAAEIITERKHNKPVELADFLRVLAAEYGAEVVVDVANEVANQVQQEKRERQGN